MIAVGVDIFSGRVNPSWLPSEAESASFLKKLQANRDAFIRPDGRPQRLGYRGVYVALLSDATSSERGLPLHFMLATGRSKNEKASVQLASELVSNMSKYPDRRTVGIDTTDRRDLQQLILGEIARVGDAAQSHSGNATELDSEPKARARRSAKKKRSASCTIEVADFNPGFWNDCKGCMENNNCYNYARNHRTDTFAQPGRATGAYPYAISGANVRKGALSDGAHLRFDCFPDSEAPRPLMALVIWPGRDYHWYRKHKGGVWGHKPGQTAARNVDNSNNIITNPETCDRGNYTEFTGYLYGCKSMRIS